MMFKIELNSLEVHSTFKIVLGSDFHYADLYYFCLDNTFFEPEQENTKGFLNFISMIENWKLKIKNLKIDASDYLPFDYSDQYIGFLIISRLNEEDIKIQVAFTTEYQGWAVNPSKLYARNFMDKSYELDGPQYIMSVHQLLQDIENSMTTIFSSFYKRDFYQVQ